MKSELEYHNFMAHPKKNVLIYDGHCSFCAAQAERLKTIAGGSVAAESFQEKGVLGRFPQLTHAECMKEIKLVTPDGKVFGGAHAIFRALSFNPFLRPLGWIYPIPPLRQIFDFGYRLVAQNRYKIRGRECPSGTCSLHAQPRKKP